MKKDVVKFLIKSILAGICIGIGGTVFLSLDNKIIGAFLFSIGLFFIVVRSLNLYTGKIGYIFDNKPIFLIEVLVTIIGNFIGTFLVGNILRFTRIYEAINKKANALCTVKINDSVLSIFVLAIFCGMLMYLAVDGYKNVKDSMGKNLCVFLAVMVFILCGFEHSIANMYYFSVASMWSLKVVVYIIIMILGNAVGGVLFSLGKKLIKKLS